MTAIGDAAWTQLNSVSEALTEQALRALSPLVVLAPHQDDETLGCGGLLATAAALGLAPKVVFLTDGAASHRHSAAWPPSRLARVRHGEAAAALAVLGVAESDVHFMNWPDAAPLSPASLEYAASLARLCLWLDAFNPQSLWAPRGGESHCDHEAAALLAKAVVRRRPGLRRFDYMVWGWGDETIANARPGERVWRLPCAAYTPQRRRALACHQTQVSDLITDAREAFLIPDDLAALVDRPAEIFLEAE